MSAAQTLLHSEGTSAAGSMLWKHARAPVVIGVMLAGLGTSYGRVADVLTVPGVIDSTSAGSVLGVRRKSDKDVGELRRLSGLTWDQLARLFKVSRRAVHFWASGKELSRENEEHLQRLLGWLRSVDQGSANLNRTMLLRALPTGDLLFDLLAERKYEAVNSLVEKAVGSRTYLQVPQQSRLGFAPSPALLVDALNDPIHRESGRSRAGKSVRVRGDG